MKRIGKKIIPLFIALLVLVGVPLTSYEEVRATGAEEFLYYTYWDLLNSVFAAQGYKMSVKDDVVKNHGVTGKQVWNNFKTWVKTNAKGVYDEVTLLPKAVTTEGIKMSQELWNAFKNYAKSFRSDVVSFENLEEVQNVLSSALGVDSKYFTGTCINNIASGKEDMYCVRFSDASDPVGYEYYIVFGIPTGASFVDFKWNYYGTRMQYVNVDGSTESRQENVLEVVKRDGNITVRDYHDMGWTFRDYCKNAIQQWIIRGNSVVASDGVYSLVSQGACPAEVPDVTPWIKNPDIPDEWRIVKPGELPDPDNGNDGDAIPVIIPIKPNPDKPSETETEESTEKPDNDKDKDPGIIFNPSTGNQIDPNTGLDIDPDTGYLIDPDTGDLIDPNTGKRVDKNKIKNRVKNLPSIASGAGNITKYFPFCIPWDMIALIKSMNASKKAPVFHFEYTFKTLNYTFIVDVDMGDYWKYIKIFRWGMTIFFVIGLFFVTVKFTTFVYRMGG